MKPHYCGCSGGSTGDGCEKTDPVSAHWTVVVAASGVVNSTDSLAADNHRVLAQTHLGAGAATKLVPAGYGHSQFFIAGAGDRCQLPRARDWQTLAVQP